MKFISALLLIQFITTVAYSQNSFEGEVIYSVDIRSNTPAATSEQLSKLIGNTQHYYIKQANYKSTFNGVLSTWNIYMNKKYYYKTSRKDTLYLHDVSIDHDTIYKTELKKNDTTIMGYRCNKLTFVCNSGIQIYYFDPQFAVDPSLYADHKEGNWYAFLSISKAIALKEIMQRKLFTLTITAKSVKRGKLDDNVFRLPENLPIVKSHTQL